MIAVVAWSDLAVTPMVSAVLGGVLVLGTVIGQAGHADGIGLDSSPMAGMDMSGSAMDGPAMAGMPMDGMPMDGPAMDGMPNPAAAGAPEAMSMSEPGMAARMPGGFHAQCADTTSCTVVFAQDASGVASLLGIEVRLQSLSPRRAVLVADGRSLELGPHQAVRFHGHTFRVSRIRAGEVTVRVTK